MKELKNNIDTEATFESVKEAVNYYTLEDIAIFDCASAFNNELSECETLEEVSEVLNKYSDFFNGAVYSVSEY